MAGKAVHRPGGAERGRTSREAMQRVAAVALALCALGAAAEGASASTERVLVVTASEGQRGALADLAERRLFDAAEREGLRPVAVRRASDLTPRAIRRAKAVVFAAGTGTVLSQEAEDALNAHVREGAGIVLAGSSVRLQPRSPDFVTLVGATPAGTDEPERAEVQVVDRLHPAAALLPRRWHPTERWVSLERNPTGRVHVLAWVDERTYTPGEGLGMGVEHPVSWCRDLGAGRAFTTTLGLSREVWEDDVFAEHLAGAMAYAAGTRTGDCGATVWSNWKRTVIDEDITDGTQLDVGPDGRVYYLERTASTLKIYDPELDIVKEAGTIPSVPGLGQGLLGLALAPDFEKTRWIYTYRHVEGLNGRLSRFTLREDDTVDLLSEEVLLNVPNEGLDHNGGGLAMRSNGDLYLAIGANDMPHFDGQYGSRNPMPLVGRLTQTDAEATTQNTNSLLGKVLRIHPEPDGTYTIPEGNMFPPGTPQTRPEILTMGHRNAFHIKVDDVTGEVLEGDVGPDGREDDPERGPKGYDELNLITGPANFGWPFCVGPNLPYKDVDSVTGQGTGEPFDCNDIRPRSGDGLRELGPASKPLIWYPYGVGEDFPEMSEAWAGGTDGGRVAIPGPKYRPFAGSTMPAFFGGSWFIADWARNWLKQVVLDDEGRVLRIQRFAPGRGTTGPMDLDIGADGSLYVLEWGGQSIPVGNPLAAKVVRYQYLRGCGTCDPTVEAPGGGLPAPGVAGNVIAGPLAQTAGFLTTSVTLAQGARATFTNLDAVAHNVASVDLDGNGRRLFASANISTGTTPIEGTERLQAGSYRFLCTVHPSMTGTLEVG